MAYQPIAAEIGAIYTLTSPDSVSIAVFNDPASGNYVGVLTDVSGLDSADIRESSSDAVDADGGVHGAFYFGRRPVILSGRVGGHASVAERNTRLDRARRASLALRGDSVLKWTPNGAQEVFVNVRRQQPFRESGGWIKDFQIPLVAELAVIQSTTLVTSGPGVARENQGNYPAYPIIQITGAGTPTSVTDGTRTFTITGLTLAGGEVVEFDMLRHTGVFTAGARAGQSANRYVNFATAQWLYLPGLGTTQTFSLSGGTGTLTAIRYRHTWA